MKETQNRNVSKSSSQFGPFNHSFIIIFLANRRIQKTSKRRERNEELKVQLQQLPSLLLFPSISFSSF